MKMRNSLKVKIIGITILGIILTCVINIATIIPIESKNTNERLEDLLITVVKTEALIIGNESAEGDFSFGNLYNQLSRMKIEGYDSGYVYIVNSEGIMQYHPNADKIGLEVENSKIKKVIERIKKGEEVQPKLISYDFNGVEKSSSYCVTEDNKYIVVATIDKSEAFEVLSRINERVIKASIFALTTVGIVAYFIAKGITKPFSLLVVAINKIAALDLSKESNEDKLKSRKDEVGVISREISKLRLVLVEVIANVNSISNTANKGSSELLQVAHNINTSSSDNAATTEELSASMQETSASMEEISNNIKELENNADKIKVMVEQGESLAKQVMERAKRLENSTLDSNNRTKEIYSNISIESKKAMDQAKSVDKIQDLANSIKDIASQTSLLSLNASIEAARAGEAGKGFSVVAKEIGNLAEVSTETVNNITKVVEEVQKAVDNMERCFGNTLKFLEEDIFKDYSNFIDISVQYSEDANTYKESMCNINESINVVNNTIGDISVSISDINLVTEEITNGVTDIAEKTTEIAQVAEKTNVMAEDNVTTTKVLQDIILKFKVED